MQLQLKEQTILDHCRIPSDTVPWPYISTAADNVSQLLTSIINNSECCHHANSKMETITKQSPSLIINKHHRFTPGSIGHLNSLVSLLDMSILMFVVSPAQK